MNLTLDDQKFLYSILQNARSADDLRGSIRVYALEVAGDCAWCTNKLVDNLMAEALKLYTDKASVNIKERTTR